MVIDKDIVIRYSKAGYWQYAHILMKDNDIEQVIFNPSYVKSDEVPSLKGMRTVEEILEVIRQFSYGNLADIHLINNELPEYHNHKVKKSVNRAVQKVNNVIRKEAVKILTDHIAPILRQNKWKFTVSWMGIPVIAVENESNEWVNVRENSDYRLIDFICYRFLNSLRMMESKGMTPEHELSFNAIPQFIGMLETEDLIKLDLYINL